MTEITNQKEVDRFRVALKFSLWTWALYWPGGGILLLTGGLDPISILVVGGSLATFAVLMLKGGLQTTSSRNMKQFLLERPLYLVGAVILLAVMAPIIAPLVDVALIVFATVYLGGMLYSMRCLVRVYEAQDQPFMKSGTDQAFIAVGIGVLASSIIFLDTLVFQFTGSAISGPPVTVALANWVNLLYPPILMLGTIGLREPMRKISWRRNDIVDDAPAAVKA